MYSSTYAVYLDFIYLHGLTLQVRLFMKFLSQKTLQFVLPL